MGKGAFGKVYKVTALDDKYEFACKIIKKNNLKDSDREIRLKNEINIQKDLENENIVHFYNYFQDNKNVYLLFELCPNNNLRTFLNKRKRLTELEVQIISIALINGLKYLKKNKIIHRDLKLSNIFIDEDMTIKIGDFGLSTILEYDEEIKFEKCGTPQYMAPEVINKKWYSYEVDIWSLGVIIYILLTGKFPFDSSKKNEIYKKILKNNYSFPEDVLISESSKELIKHILVLDTKKRLSLEQILEHDFFHQGISIPKLLPISSLNSPPTLDYIKKYIPDIDENGVSKKIINKEEIQEDEIKEDIFVLPEPKIWVKKYDYFPRFGYALLYNNGLYGAYFNDTTNILLNPNENEFYYMINTKDKNKCSKYKLNYYPKDIEKKVLLIQGFKDHLDGIIKTDLEGYFKASSEYNYDEENINIYDDEELENNNELIFVDYIFFSTITDVFCLSTGYNQFIFKDKTIMIVTKQEPLIITYFDESNNKYHDYDIILKNTYPEIRSKCESISLVILEIKMKEIILEKI